MVRPLDIVHVVMVSTTDGVLEQGFIEQYKGYLQAHKVSGGSSHKGDAQRGGGHCCRWTLGWRVTHAPFLPCWLLRCKAR